MNYIWAFMILKSMDKNTTMYFYIMTPRGKVGVLILITTATIMMAASNDLLVSLGQVLCHFYYFI